MAKTDLTSVELPDGSGVSAAKFALPQDHWIYREEPHTFEPIALLHPNARFHFEARAREAIRRATLMGKDMEFDPDALVQNLSTLVCGERTLLPKAQSRG